MNEFEDDTEAFKIKMAIRSAFMGEPLTPENKELLRRCLNQYFIVDRDSISKVITIMKGW